MYALGSDRVGLAVSTAGKATGCGASTAMSGHLAGEDFVLSSELLVLGDEPLDAMIFELGAGREIWSKFCKLCRIKLWVCDDSLGCHVGSFVAVW
jgi:hypothetical protein